MSEWQPIETAPKDGTAILLWGYADGIFIGWWFDTKTYEFGVLKRASEGWSGGWKMALGSAPKPTHWQPLPVVSEEMKA